MQPNLYLYDVFEREINVYFFHWTHIFQLHIAYK